LLQPSLLNSADKLTMPKQYTLSKNERLKSRKWIEQLFKEGESFSMPPYRVYYMPVNNTTNEKEKKSFIQFGVGVSSKNFKKAVDRNRIKRLTREGWRLQKNELEKMVSLQNKSFIFFFIYTGREIPDFVLVKEKTGGIINRLMKKITAP
jgi:ribonuclease P protein component